MSLFYISKNVSNGSQESALLNPPYTGLLIENNAFEIIKGVKGLVKTLILDVSPLNPDKIRLPIFNPKSSIFLINNFVIDIIAYCLFE